MIIPYEEVQIISYFNENASVLTTSYEEEGTMLTVECKESDYEKYHEYIVGDANIWINN